MDLHEFVAEVPELHPDGAVGGLDSFLFPAESAAFDPFHAQAKSGGFAEDKGSKFFGVGWEGEHSQEMAGSGTPSFSISARMPLLLLT